MLCVSKHGGLEHLWLDVAAVGRQPETVGAALRFLEENLVGIESQTYNTVMFESQTSAHILKLHACVEAVFVQLNLQV